MTTVEQHSNKDTSLTTHALSLYLYTETDDPFVNLLCISPCEYTQQAHICSFCYCHLSKYLIIVSVILVHNTHIICIFHDYSTFQSCYSGMIVSKLWHAFYFHKKFSTNGTQHNSIWMTSGWQAQKGSHLLKIIPGVTMLHFLWVNLWHERNNWHTLSSNNHPN